MKLRARFTCYGEVWHEGDFPTVKAAQEFAEEHMRKEWVPGARFRWYRIDRDGELVWVSSDYGSWANHHIERVEPS